MADRCPHCSFDPTTLSDYCDKHRPTDASEGRATPDVEWLHRFLNASVFGPPPSDIQRAHGIVDALVAQSATAHTDPLGAVSSIDYQQRRGMLADTVDWAVLEYDEFMRDDAYDAQKVLDRIANRLREVRDMLNAIDRGNGNG